MVQILCVLFVEPRVWCKSFGFLCLAPVQILWIICFEQVLIAWVLFVGPGAKTLEQVQILCVCF